MTRSLLAATLICAAPLQAGILDAWWAVNETLSADADDPSLGISGMVFAALWDGDVNDSSTNLLTGTAYGNATVTNGVIYLDGTGDYVSYPDNNAFDFGTGAFSVSAWIRTSGSAQSFMRICGKTIAVSGLLTDGWIAYLRESDDALRSVRDGGVVSPATPIDVIDGTWHHVAVVYTATNTCQFWVDSSLDGEAALTSGDINNAEAFTVGTTSMDLATGFQPNFYTGQMGPLRVYEKALSASEIDTLYAEGSP